MKKVIPRNPPVLTVYETDRIVKFTKLISDLKKREEEHGGLFTLNFKEAYILQAIVPYLDGNLRDFSKKCGVDVETLEKIKNTNWDGFFDNVIPTRSKEMIEDKYQMMVKADKVVDERLERLDTTALAAANISRNYLEQGRLLTGLATNINENRNKVYDNQSLPLTERIRAIEEEILRTQGGGIEKIEEAEVSS